MNKEQIKRLIKKLRRTAETGEDWADICALEVQMNAPAKRYRPVNLHGVDPERLMVEDPDGEYCLASDAFLNDSVGRFKTPREMFEEDMRRITSAATEACREMGCYCDDYPPKRDCVMCQLRAALQNEVQS